MSVVILFCTTCCTSESVCYESVDVVTTITFRSYRMSKFPTPSETVTVHCWSELQYATSLVPTTKSSRYDRSLTPRGADQNTRPKCLLLLPPFPPLSNSLRYETLSMNYSLTIDDHTIRVRLWCGNGHLVVQLYLLEKATKTRARSRVRTMRITSGKVVTTQQSSVYIFVFGHVNENGGNSVTDLYSINAGSARCNRTNVIAKKSVYAIRSINTLERSTSCGELAKTRGAL